MSVFIESKFGFLTITVAASPLSEADLSLEAEVFWPSESLPVAVLKYWLGMFLNLLIKADIQHQIAEVTIQSSVPACFSLSSYIWVFRGYGRALQSYLCLMTWKP